MSAAPVNWDDVPVRQVTVGPIEGAWRDLGTAAGTRLLGLRRVQIPARQALHAGAHAQRRGRAVLRPRRLRAELAGRRHLRGRRRRLPRAPRRGAGPHPRRRPRRPRRPRLRRAHRLGGLLPAARQGRRGSAAAGSRPARPPHPFKQEAAVGELEMPAEPSRAAGDHREPRRRARAGRSSAASSRPRAARSAPRPAPSARRCGTSPSPPASWACRRTATAARRSCSSSSRATACTSSRRRARPAGSRRSARSRPATSSSCLAGAGAAHAFRAGPGGLTYLAYGNRDRNDTIWYPRSRKVAFPGLGVIGRVEPLGYWDGEE